MQHQNGLLKAIRHFGSQTMLANAIGASQRSISNWLNREKRIPYKYAVTIFYLTNGNVSLNEDRGVKSSFVPLNTQHHS